MEFVNVPLVSGRRERGQGLTSVMDVEVWRLEGPAVQVIALPLPPLPFNFSSKNGFGAFFGLNNFWSQEARDPPDSMWFLLSQPAGKH